MEILHIFSVTGNGKRENLTENGNWGTAQKRSTRSGAPLFCFSRKIALDLASILEHTKRSHEALTLYKSTKFDYVFGKEDYADFQEYNSRYVIETTAFKLIKEWYRKPLEEEDAQFRMPMDILRDLKTARKISSSMNRIDDITVGQALRALGYERIGKKIPGMGTRYGYKVMQLY
jgi:hypothetical protein